MSLKYRNQHHHAMIRTRLRLIGRLLLELKKINISITDFASVFKPNNYDSVLEAINVVAKLNAEENKYKSPSTAFACGTLLKKCGKTYISELIKVQNKERKQEVEDFLKLLEEDYGISINKTVLENQLEHKRQRKLLFQQ
ncbi:hypothetical protein NQ314_018061 [Rhamnusium bicolor]|uniref:Uncharacterized protein n=1 Tax=Rhamnusium bicolor TaxID=1586634 RepID=A0AAV8WS94_9CUCU|nr:hypothetical protein NQ314_018061 [Rhamnusium bicolor]